MPDIWAPTAHLRFVERPSVFTKGKHLRILQQWFAPNVPDYMRKGSEGEWRDVPTEPEL